MKDDTRENERSALAECRRNASSPAGLAFVYWMEARRQRRMEDAASASRDSFEKRQGAYQELKAMLAELHRET